MQKFHVLWQIEKSGPFALHPTLIWQSGPIFKDPPPSPAPSPLCVLLKCTVTGGVLQTMKTVEDPSHDPTCP